MIAALTNHLWQSTLFALAAGVVAFALRKNGAHIRHRVWVIASLKFLVPFSVLMSLGSALPSLTPASETAAPATLEASLSVAVDRFAQPFTDDVFFASTPATTQPPANWTAIIIVSTWAGGFLAVAFMRLRAWRRIRAAVRLSAPLSLVATGLQPRGTDVPVRSAPGLLEPGVVGLWRPVLLLPAGIEQQLSPRQLDAVLTHELCHVQRRDNLTSAIHMVVEATFWFHPLVWFVGARLVDERERACDEHVLRVCGEPRTYAESILNVCKLYVESPLACVSGVGGSDLRKRVAAILVNRVGLQLSLVRKVTLAMAAVLAIALPLVAGMVTAPLRAAAFAAAQNAAASADQSRKFEVASVKRCDPDAPNPGGRSGGASQASPGYVYLSCYTLRALVMLAYGAETLLNKPYGPGGAEGAPELVRGGPSWAYTEKFTIEAKGESVTEPQALTTATGQWAIKDPMMASMLRALLEDRFQLKTHRATETQTMFALTAAKGGHKMKQLAPGDCWEYQTGKPLIGRPANVPLCGVFGGDGWGSSQATGMKFGGSAPGEGRRFVDYLFFMLRRIVIDRTGLEGRYSFTLDFTPDDSTPGVNGRGGPGPQVRPETFKNGSTIFKALEEQLGLKLEQVKASAEYIVIDRAQPLRPDSPAPIAPYSRALGAASQAPARGIGAGR